MMSSHSRFAAWVRQWLRAHRPRTIVRPARLELEHLEAREMPARAAALALGAEAGQLPRVQLYDREMILIRTWTAYDSSVTSGVKAALADLNRDGVPEVVTVAFSGSRPLVRVWEGVSGTLMSQFWAGGFQVEGEVHVAAGEIGHGESGVVVGLTAGGRSQVRVFTSEGVLRRRIEVGPAAWTGAVRVALGYGTSGNAVVWVAAGPGERRWSRVMRCVLVKRWPVSQPMLRP